MVRHRLYHGALNLRLLSEVSLYRFHDAHLRFMAYYGISGVEEMKEPNCVLANLPAVPRFSAGSPSDVHNSVANIAASFIAVVFGVVHCLAWSSHFPSATEKLAWRTASLVIAAAPVITIVASMINLLWILGIIDRGHKFIKPFIRWPTFAVLVPYTGLLLYVLARILLLVLMFTTLRSLPSAAYETVYWTTWVPHI